MLEQVFDTFQMILFYDLPKNSAGVPAIYDQAIKKWHFGPYENVGTDTPAVLIKGETVRMTNIGQGVVEHEYQIVIQGWVQATNRRNSERFSQELARQIREILLIHRVMWVLTPCPICQKYTLSPQHFTIDHAALMAPYVTDAQADFDAIWDTIRSSASPTLEDSGLAATAFLKLYDEVTSSSVIAGLDDDARDRIVMYKADRRRPVRLLYNSYVSDVKPSDGGESQQLLYGSQVSVNCRELVRASAYGPDNVPTDAWERR